MSGSQLTYLDGAPTDDVNHPTWQHHTNVFEKNTVAAGIRKHYTDPEALTLDDYLLYSGLCQGLMYSYALDSMRANPLCYGSLFWMYADCWGEIGWTIIDYYLRRKPSWYFVRRAFAPVRLILRPVGDHIRLIVANDTLDEWALPVEYGYISFDGKVRRLQEQAVRVPAQSRLDALVFERGDFDPTAGLWIARAPDVSPSTFRALDYRQLRVPGVDLGWQITPTSDRECRLTVSAPTYAHAVHLLLPDGVLPSDNYFDLLPGDRREIGLASLQPFDLAAVRVRAVNSR